MAESCGGWPWEITGEPATGAIRTRWFWRWHLLAQARAAAFKAGIK